MPKHPDIEDLIRSVYRNRDSSELIRFLRGTDTITPELRKVIVDILEGKLQATPKRKTYKDVISITQLKGFIKYYRKLVETTNCQ